MGRQADMTAAMAPLVLFDLDGTLVDTAADLCSAANVLRRARGLDVIGLASFRASVSRGSRAMLEVAFPALDPTSREALVPEFLRHYAAAIAAHSALFPGMQDVLDAIEARGNRWGVVSNKPEGLARAVVDALGLESRCAVLVGGDTLAVRKPAPEPLWHACARVGIESCMAVYVGDDARDIEAARAAGMRGIAAAWGYRDAVDPIEAWGADAIVEHPLDLLVPGMLCMRSACAG